MYRKDIIARVVMFIAITCSSFFLKLEYSSIASEVINVVSIASAVYFTAFAGIQASSRLRDVLKQPDGLSKNKTQRVVFNSYAKNALIIGFLTIVMSIIVLLFESKFGTQQTCSSVQQTSGINGSNIQPFNQTSDMLMMSSQVLSSIAMGLFSINFLAMINIGRFVVNRLAYDR